ncbi:DoxX family protein [Flavobacterium sp.]|uniref:DoxX family protein n=1 Tax=Flavobacterium sp. TaxID=239 RepID=UPI0037511A0E
MNLFNSIVILSSFSFLFYGISYFISPHMKNEFKRFKLEKLGLLTIVLEILGAIGLLIGFWYKPILLLSSGGLALLMFLGVIVRIKLKDSLWISLPAVFFMGLNAYIFYVTITL